MSIISDAWEEAFNEREQEMTWTQNRQDETWTRFAAAALQGMVTTASRHSESGIDERVAKMAAEYADAMMKEWEKR